MSLEIFLFADSASPPANRHSVLKTAEHIFYYGKERSRLIIDIADWCEAVRHFVGSDLIGFKLFGTQAVLRSEEAMERIQQVEKSGELDQRIQQIKETRAEFVAQMERHH